MTMCVIITLLSVRHNMINEPPSNVLLVERSRMSENEGIPTPAKGDDESKVIPLAEGEGDGQAAGNTEDEAKDKGAKQLEEVKPLTAAEVRAERHRDVVAAKIASHTASGLTVVAVTGPPPKPGTANVCILRGFSTHVFVIPQFSLELTQTEWVNVPLDQLEDIHRIANANQVPLEIDEAAE